MALYLVNLANLVQKKGEIRSIGTDWNPNKNDEEGKEVSAWFAKYGGKVLEDTVAQVRGEPKRDEASRTILGDEKLSAWML